MKKESGILKKAIITGAAALIIRLVHFLLSWRYNPLDGDLVLDARIYHNWAVALTRGGDPGPTQLMQSPLYPWLISLVYRITGPLPDAVFLLQAVAGAVSCALIVIITRRLFNSTGAALTAGIAGAVYLPLIFYQQVMVPATLIILLNLIFVTLLVPEEPMPGKSRTFSAGVALGLSVMAKPVALLLLPFALIHIITVGGRVLPGFRDIITGKSHPSGNSSKQHKYPGTNSAFLPSSREKTVLSLIMLAGLILSISPLTIRNAVLTGEFIPLTTGGGINFYIGNNRGANGYYSVPEYRGGSLGGTPVEQWHRMTVTAERELGRDLTGGEISRFWLEKGLQYIRRHPADWLGLLWQKFIFFWNSYERANVESFQFHRRFPGLLGLPLLLFGIVAPPAVLGIFLTRNHRRELWLLYGGVITYLLAALAFYVLGRYRLPVVPFLLPFLGAALWEIVSLVRSRRISELVLALAALSVLFFFSNMTVARDTRAGTSGKLTRLGRVYLDEGDTTRAVSSFREALDSDPDNRQAARFLNMIKTKIPPAERMKNSMQGK